MLSVARFLFAETAFDENVCKYDLSICTIFQNEAPYLKEWIEFHKQVGVQHFFLFNDQSEDNFVEVLAPYIEAGELDLYEWPIPKDIPWIPQQQACFNEGLRITNGVSRWVAFIDTDEFLFPVTQERLVDVLKEYEKFGGIKVHWVMYGTSDVPKIPEGRLMIETLTRRLSSSHWRNTTGGKSIVKPHRARSSGNIHTFVYKNPYYAVYEGKKRSSGYSLKRLRINHYWTRDEDFFYKVKFPRHEKCERQKASVTEADYEGVQPMLKRMNGVEDKAIFRFIPRLKEKMFPSSSG